MGFSRSKHPQKTGNRKHTILKVENSKTLLDVYNLFSKDYVEIRFIYQRIIDLGPWNIQ